MHEMTSLRHKHPVLAPKLQYMHRVHLHSKNALKSNKAGIMREMTSLRHEHPVLAPKVQ